MCQAHRLPEGLAEPGVQVFAGDLFNHEAEDHVVRIGIDGLCSGLIPERSFADHVDLAFLVFSPGVLPAKSRFSG